MARLGWVYPTEDFAHVYARRLGEPELQPIGAVEPERWRPMDCVGVTRIGLFRLEDGKIVEHWDIVQEIPADMAHDNGKF